MNPDTSGILGGVTSALNGVLGPSAGLIGNGVTAAQLSAVIAPQAMTADGEIIAPQVVSPPSSPAAASAKTLGVSTTSNLILGHSPVTIAVVAIIAWKLFF